MVKKLLSVGFVLAGLAVLFSSAFSEPRFALRTGSRCDVCHVNPTGGGMRNDYGALYYSVEELPMPGLKQKIGSTTIDRELSKSVHFGSDFRMLYYSNTEPPEENSFFQMQGDLYLNLALNEYLSAYFRKGVYTDYEAYGMIKFNKLDSYLKFGYLSPPYALKFVEHNAFVRTQLALDQHSNDAGVEFGYEPQPFSFAFGVFNGTNGPIDYNNNKAVYFRSLYVKNLDQKTRLLLGASIRNMNSGINERRNYTSWGIDAGFSYSRFAFLSEADWVYQNQDQIALLAEGSCVLAKGIDLRTSYEYLRPDYPSSSEKMERLSFGIALFPLPSSEVQAKYRFHLGNSSEKDRLFLTLHLFM
jgi:hypothetical protein